MPKLVVSALRHGDLHGEPLRRDRCNSGTGRARHLCTRRRARTGRGLEVGIEGCRRGQFHAGRYRYVMNWPRGQLAHDEGRRNWLNDRGQVGFREALGE